MIVYDVQDFVSNVDPKVFDAIFITENGRIKMETSLDLNGHTLRGENVLMNDLDLNGSTVSDGGTNLFFKASVRWKSRRIWIWEEMQCVMKYPIVQRKKWANGDENRS